MRQKEQFNSVFVLVRSLHYKLVFVGFEVVDDQKDFPVLILDQVLQKLNCILF